jgi:hypothetical protein
MAILNDDDILKYCPSLASLIGTDELDGKLDYVQSLVESSVGCNRAIEPQVWTEKINYTYSSPRRNEFYLAYTPIDLTYIPTIEIRKGFDPVHSEYALLNSLYYDDNIYPFYRRGLDEYETLEPDDYTLYQNGELLIHKATLIRDLRIEYKSGLDFSTNTQEIKNFKSAVGNLLNFITSNGSYQGLEEVQVPFDEYTIRYNSRNSEPFVIPEQLMLPFKKYRPRGQSV